MNESNPSSPQSPTSTPRSHSQPKMIRVNGACRVQGCNCKTFTAHIFKPRKCRFCFHMIPWHDVDYRARTEEDDREERRQQTEIEAAGISVQELVYNFDHPAPKPVIHSFEHMYLRDVSVTQLKAYYGDIDSHVASPPETRVGKDGAMGKDKVLEKVDELKDRKHKIVHSVEDKLDTEHLEQLYLDEQSFTENEHRRQRRMNGLPPNISDGILDKKSYTWNGHSHIDDSMSSLIAHKHLASALLIFFKAMDLDGSDTVEDYELFRLFIMLSYPLTDANTEEEDEDDDATATRISLIQFQVNLCYKFLSIFSSKRVLPHQHLSDYLSYKYLLYILDHFNGDATSTDDDDESRIVKTIFHSSPIDLEPRSVNITVFQHQKSALSSVHRAILNSLISKVTLSTASVVSFYASLTSSLELFFKCINRHYIHNENMVNYASFWSIYCLVTFINDSNNHRSSAIKYQSLKDPSTILDHTPPSVFHHSQYNALCVEQWLSLTNGRDECMIGVAVNHIRHMFLSDTTLYRNNDQLLKNLMAFTYYYNFYYLSIENVLNEIIQLIDINGSNMIEELEYKRFINIVENVDFVVAQGRWMTFVHKCLISDTEGVIIPPTTAKESLSIPVNVAFRCMKNDLLSLFHPSSSKTACIHHQLSTASLLHHLLSTKSKIHSMMCSINNTVACLFALMDEDSSGTIEKEEFLSFFRMVDDSTNVVDIESRWVSFINSSPQSDQTTPVRFSAATSIPVVSAINFTRQHILISPLSLEETSHLLRTMIHTYVTVVNTVDSCLIRLFSAIVKPVFSTTCRSIDDIASNIDNSSNYNAIPLLTTATVMTLLTINQPSVPNLMVSYHHYYNFCVYVYDMTDDEVAISWRNLTKRLKTQSRETNGKKKRVHIPRIKLETVSRSPPSTDADANTPSLITLKEAVQFSRTAVICKGGRSHVQACINSINEEASSFLDRSSQLRRALTELFQLLDSDYSGWIDEGELTRYLVMIEEIEKDDAIALFRQLFNGRKSNKIEEEATSSIHSNCVSIDDCVAWAMERCLQSSSRDHSTSAHSIADVEELIELIESIVLQLRSDFLNLEAALIELFGSLDCDGSQTVEEREWITFCVTVFHQTVFDAKLHWEEFVSQTKSARVDNKILTNRQQNITLTHAVETARTMVLNSLNAGETINMLTQRIIEYCKTFQQSLSTRRSSLSDRLELHPQLVSRAKSRKRQPLFSSLKYMDDAVSSHHLMQRIVSMQDQLENMKHHLQKTTPLMEPISPPEMFTPRTKEVIRGLVRANSQVNVVVIGLSSIGIEAAITLSRCSNVRVLIMDDQACWKRGKRAGEFYKAVGNDNDSVSRKYISLHPTAILIHIDPGVECEKADSMIKLVDGVMLCVDDPLKKRDIGRRIIGKPWCEGYMSNNSIYGQFRCVFPGHNPVTLSPFDESYRSTDYPESIHNSVALAMIASPTVLASRMCQSLLKFILTTSGAIVVKSEMSFLDNSVINAIAKSTY